MEYTTATHTAPKRDTVALVLGWSIIITMVIGSVIIIGLGLYYAGAFDA